MTVSAQNNGVGYRGYQEPNTQGTDFNAQTFLIWQALSKISTAKLVRVQSVTNDGGLAPVGFVDILPLVNQIDGAGNSVPHGTISHCSYFRLQGGTNAVILDPQVGDIGIAVFADRDTSSATANQGAANPGSRRILDYSDGLYIGLCLGGTPAQYVQFNADGISMVSPTKITLQVGDSSIVVDGVSITQTTETATTTATVSIASVAPEVTTTAPIIGLNGDVTQTTGAGTGSVTLQGPVHVNTEVTAGTIPLTGHLHSNSGGTGNSGPAIP